MISVSDRFDACLPWVLREECPQPGDWSNPKNFSRDSEDPGGPTMCGIIQREYDHYRKVCGIPTRPVIDISEAEGHWIYENWYWLPHTPLIPVGLDLSFFDASVNEGATEAVRMLQRSIGVGADGVWGPVTAEALPASSRVSAVISSFAVHRETVYRESRGFGRFGRDWLARAQRICTKSLEMVGG